MKKNARGTEVSYYYAINLITNQVAYEWARAGADGLFGKVLDVKRERTYGNSRLDLYLETVDEDGVVHAQDGEPDELLYKGDA